MTFSRHARRISTILLSCLLILGICFTWGGCAKKLPKPEGFFPDYKGPQIAVTPTTLRLGVSTLLKTQIVIAGMGFQPGDSVFVDLIGTQEKPVKIPIDSSPVDETGQFTIVVNDNIKKSGILKLDTDPADGAPVVVGDPIPVGKYYLKAISVNSDRKAECLIQFDPPSKGDKFKDKIASWFGKIKIRR